MAGDPAGLVQQPVAQPLELPRALLLGEAQLGGPGDQVVGEHHQPQPHLVVVKRLEGEVAQTAVLALADGVLDPRVPAAGQIKQGDSRLADR